MFGDADETSMYFVYWFEDVFEQLLKKIHRIRIHRSDDWKKNEFDDSNFGPLSISIQLPFHPHIVSERVCVWDLFFLRFRFSFWSACVSFVCEIFFSCGCCYWLCLSSAELAFGLFSNMSFAHNSLCAISFFLFPSFALASLFLSVLRARSHHANSLDFTLSSVYVCVFASVRPNADTKYAMHCFQAVIKSIHSRRDR